MENSRLREALLTFYDSPAAPPAISGGAGLEHPSGSVTASRSLIKHSTALQGPSAHDQCHWSESSCQGAVLT